MTGPTLEIRLEDPAAPLRAELAALRAQLSHVQQTLDPAPTVWQRLVATVKTAFRPVAQPAAPADTFQPFNLPASTPTICPTSDPRPLAFPPAAALLSREPLFLDIETTGLYKKDDPRVVEVAVIDPTGRVLFSTLVNPQKPIPAAATAANGISDSDVADAPLWRDILPYLRRILQGRLVIAHNVKFDSGFIPADWGIEWACSKDLANARLGKADWWAIKQNPLLGGSLTARLHQCNLQPGPEHTAAGDCLSTLRLVRHLAGQTQPVELVY